MKKTFGMILVVCVSVLCLSACGSKDANVKAESLQSQIDELSKRVNKLEGNLASDSNDFSATEMGSKEETVDIPNIIDQETDKEASGKNTEKKSISVGESMTVSTDDGSYTISIQGAHRMTTEDHYVKEDIPEGFSLVSVRCIVENQDYSGMYDNLLSSGDLVLSSSGKTIRAQDENGFDCESYDFTPFNDEEYSVTEIPVGAKMRLSLPFKVPEKDAKIKLIVQDTVIEIPID